MKTMRLIALFSTFFGIFSCTQAQKKTDEADAKPRQVQKTDAEWKKELTAAQYDVLRHEGTERPFSSPLNANHKKGTYVCAACQTPLFSSDNKFESGTGWPSFYKPLFAKNIDEVKRQLSGDGAHRSRVPCLRRTLGTRI